MLKKTMTRLVTATAAAGAAITLTVAPASAAGELPPNIKDGSAAASIGCSLINTIGNPCSCGLDPDYVFQHCDKSGNYHETSAETDAANAKIDAANAHIVGGEF